MKHNCAQCGQPIEFIAYLVYPADCDPCRICSPSCLVEYAWAQKEQQQKMSKSKPVEILLGYHAIRCDVCAEHYARGKRDAVDLKILHDNGHVWPGFAGEPDGGNYGGSDF